MANDPGRGGVPSESEADVAKKAGRRNDVTVRFLRIEDSLLPPLTQPPCHVSHERDQCH